MKTLRTLLLLVLVPATAALAGGPKPVNDLAAALEKAKTEGKMLFVQIGRETCGNCQALKAMIKSGDLRLSPSKFIYADVNNDDRATNKLFSATFNVKGSTLPFVAIAAPDGVKLADHTGYGSAEEFQDLIRTAEKAARANAKAKTAKP
jgi:Thioredoxin-like